MQIQKTTSIQIKNHLYSKNPVKVKILVHVVTTSSCSTRFKVQTSFGTTPICSTAFSKDYSINLPKVTFYSSASVYTIIYLLI